VRLVLPVLPVLLALSSILLAGCQSTTQIVRPGGDAPSPVQADRRNPADPAEMERRARTRLELAALYYSRGQNATALDELRQAQAMKPDLPGANSLRGLILASMGEFAQAEESFRRALAIDARDADAAHNYGWFLCQQRRYEDADVQFRGALAQPQYADSVRTLLAQGVCQARAGRWADAEQTLSRSYELDPSNPVTAYNLAEVLMRRGELERARVYVSRINAVPDLVSAQSLWLAARIERRRGNMEALADHGRRLRERFPQSPEALQFDRGRFDD
jgi:type IV pilus assembly protein PilF